MRGYTQEELVPYFIQELNTPEKKIEYIMNSLTSSKEIYKHGGHVIMKNRDQTFRLQFDNRRHIISEETFEVSNDDTKIGVNGKTSYDSADDLADYTPVYSMKNSVYSMKNSVDSENSKNSNSNNSVDSDNSWDNSIENTTSYVLLDSKPVKDVTESRNFRYLMKLSRNSAYNKETSGVTSNNYKGVKDILVRNFLKGLLHVPSKFNLQNDFHSYADIIAYLHSYDPSIKMTKSGISNLKNRKMIFRTVPRNNESLKFVEFVKLKYPDFDVDSFLSKKG